jgi:NitT/TauT family transport system substrate-binding protein
LFLLFREFYRDICETQLNDTDHLITPAVRNKRLQATVREGIMRLKRVVCFAVVTIACLVNGDIVMAEVLKVPYVSISGFQAPLWLGEKTGAFRKNQLEVQLIYMPGGSLIVQTLLSGEVGIASLAPPSAISAWTKGAELALVAGGIERALNVLMVSPKIKTPEDLKGKRVAISRFGSLSDVSLRDALRFYKLRPSQDVAIAQIGGLGERMVALTSGVVDAAILNVDQVYQAEKLGYQVLIDLRKLPLNYSTQGIVVSKEFLRNQRNTVKRFLKVYIEGIKIFKTEKDLSMETLARYIKTNDHEILSKTYDVYREAWESVPYVRREGVVQALESMPDLPSKGSKLNLDRLIDNSIIQELEKEGFLKELYPDGSKR